MVRQYALSDKAYVYWDKNKVQSRELGGLYQTQPSQSKSNIHNLNDSNEIVLGFFWVSSFTEKRIFFDGPLSGYYRKYDCKADTVENFYDIKTDSYITIIGYTDSGGSIYATSAPACLDCSKQGGTNIKPEFWED